MGRHIMFFNIPAMGHVFPTLGIVAELVRRGHRVSYAATSDRAEYAAGAGATVLPYDSSRPNDADSTFVVPSRDEHIGRSLLNFLAEAEATVPQLEPQLIADKPDLILFDRMAFAGRLLAERHGIPSVQLWPMMISGKQWSMGSVVPVDLGHPLILDFARQLDKYLADLGLPMPMDEFLAPPVRHNLAFYPRAFQYSGENFGPDFSFVGPCTAPRAGQRPWSPPASGAPVVLITLGTLNNHRPDFYRLCFEAFGASDWHAVIAIGRRVNPYALGRAPANVEVAPVVPQLEVLRHAKVFVSHAGMGGIMEAAAAGVPQIAIGGTLEQDLNAIRLAELGLGSSLHFENLSGESLLAEVTRVAGDPSIAAAVAGMRDEVAAAGGPTRAADIIESLL